MSTITTIQAGDNISTSRTDINNNFNALNVDKVETSVIDTDTTLSANSDDRVATQKAVKAYVDGGGDVPVGTKVVPTGAVLPYAGSSAPAYFLLCDGSAVSRTTYSDLFAITGTAYGAGNGSTTFNVPDLRSSFPLGGGTERTRVMTFDGASAVDPATDTITVTSNDWLHTGQAVALTGPALPTGLSATTYYVIRTSATAIKLATSVANANEGTAVDITADGSGTCTLTQTLTARTVGATGGEETHALTNAEMASHSHSFVTGSNSAPQNNPGIFAPGGFTAPGTNSTLINPTGSDTPHNTMPPYTVVNFIIKT